MAKKNSAQQAAQAKAKKQKKLLIVLGVGLVVALAFAVNTMMHLGAQPAATPPGATTTTTTNPDGSTSTATDISAVVPGIAAVPVSALRLFTGFGKKDPFNDGGPGATATATAKGPTGGKPTKQPSAPLTGAVITVNNVKLALALGANFGHAPGFPDVWLFRLIKVTHTSALIGVVGTTQQFTLHTRRPLTLEQNGGWRYTLILQPAGTGAPMTVQPPIHDQTTP